MHAHVQMKLTFVSTYAVTTSSIVIVNYITVGCIFPMVISSEFRIGQHRDDDHREGTLHFIFFCDALDFNFAVLNFETPS